MTSIDVDKIRRDFPILYTKTSHGKPLVYLDSAATSQKPAKVIEAVSDYYKTYNANIHRGLYDISAKATEEYKRSKELVAEFINAESYNEIIYTRNATESINLVALSWAERNIRKGDMILTTQMEHHSNIVPWQMLAKRKGARIAYAKLDDGSTIDVDDYRKNLEKGPKLVTFTHVSNVLGTVNDAQTLTKMAHDAGATVLIDAAQSVPHMSVDVKRIGCDFMAFSSHKMLGPAGIGVLYGKEEILEQTEPLYGGGDMIRSVRFDSCTWNELPWKFEAGTSNVEGGIGLGAAVEYLNGVGMSRIRQHEIYLVRYALERLDGLEGVIVYGVGKKDMTESNRAGVVSFNITGAHAHDVAEIFNSEGIAIRAGHHCAMPLVNEVLGEPSVARMSF
ncbi:MAG: SufS family cysteine desulfurase, partial [Candidatus Marsarchaeota archaeon]|nr:SufS family cysteine desulfurase [Candidatus Marsarchaeota archaeon]